MAKMPTESEVMQSLAETGKALADKVSEQAREGKDFNPDSRVGVIPEGVWQEHKANKQEDLG